MIPVLLGLGSLIAKVAAAAAIPRVIKALSAMGGATETFRANPSQPAPETVSAPVQQSKKVLYKKYPLTDHSYRYSTYGERTKVAGDLDSDWGYAGLWHHSPSGLDLATYRTYDSAQGRWISRDPLGEGVNFTHRVCGNTPGSIPNPLAAVVDGPASVRAMVQGRNQFEGLDYNLYRYCGNNPINNTDPSGFMWRCVAYTPMGIQVNDGMFCAFWCGYVCVFVPPHPPFVAPLAYPMAAPGPCTPLLILPFL